MCNGGLTSPKHSRFLETNKDLPESASLSFAIVSVIFLPLTTVASIMGMNTTDVRDMPRSQWVFWAAGLLLATITGLFCLWCTAQLDELGTWIRNRFARLAQYRIQPTYKIQIQRPRKHDEEEVDLDKDEHEIMEYRGRRRGGTKFQGDLGVV